MLSSDVDLKIGISGFDFGAVVSSRNQSAQVDDIIPAVYVADEQGVLSFKVDTLEPTPSLKLKFNYKFEDYESDVQAMLPAKYKSTFHITGYYTPNESDFGGSSTTSTTLITGSGPTRKEYTITSSTSARANFLKAVAVEGEGFLLNNTHVHTTNTTVSGSYDPIRVNSSIQTDSTVPLGTQNRPLEADSCAIARSGSQGEVIPDAANVTVVGRGQRKAIDRVASNEQGGIFHIDLYMGTDKTAANLISEDKDVFLESL